MSCSLPFTLELSRALARLVALAVVVVVFGGVASATTLTFHVRTEDAELREATFLAQDLRQLLSLKATPATVKVVDGGTLTVTFAHAADASILDRAHLDPIGQGLVESKREGAQVTLILNAPYRAVIRQQALRETEVLATRRLVTTPGAAVRVDAAASQLVIDLPPTADVAAVTARLERPERIQLCFSDPFDASVRRLLDDKAAAAAGLRIAVRTWQLDGHEQRERFFEADDEATLRRGLATLTARAPLPATQRWVIGPSEVHVRAYACSTHEAIDGAHLVDVNEGIDALTRQAQVTLAFDAATAAQLLALSTAARGKRLILTVDDWAESAAIIEGPIPGGRARLSLPGATPEDVRASAYEIFFRLRPGALPLKR